MSTQNVSLTPLGYTDVNDNVPNANYANQSPLLAYGNLSQYGERRTIIQFDVNSEISASKINSAVLNLGVRIATDHGAGGNGKLYYSSAFTYGYIFNDVTNNNFSSLVTQGVRTLKSNVMFSSSSFVSNQFDVTSAVANNINDGVLTLVIEGYAGLAWQIDASSIGLVINYEKPAEVLPVKPVVVSPNGTYENRQSSIKFEWIYKSQTHATQASATLEYRSGISCSYTVINVYSSNNYYTMPANTLNTGIYEWRLKTTDTDGKTSDYAYSSFTVIDRPSIPLITSIDNKCISTITWSSAEQVAYEIEIYKDNNLEYSKKISGAENNYKPNMFFSNTSYTIRIRVCNTYGLWSEWGSKIQTFTFTNPSKPIIIVSPYNHEIIIKSNIVGAMIYKSENNSDYIPISNIGEDGTYTDYKVASDSKYRYFVRNYADGYTDSDKQLGQITLKGVILQNELGYVNLRLSSSQFMNYNKSISTEKVINKFSGRQYGVSEFGEYREKSISLSVALLEDELAKLEELYYSNQVLVYRDFRGSKFHCVIENIGETQLTRNYYTLDLTIYQVDGREEINIYE